MITEQSWKEGFSTRLKERMTELKMQQKELAEKIFMSPATVQYYCQARAIPSGYTLSLIGAALNCTVAYLIGEEEQ
jgi:transcriptional regulator with XRE-family HTH domain